MNNTVYDITSYNDILREKESEQLTKTKKLKEDCPSIKKILDDISDYNFNAIINNVEKDSFVRENDRLYSKLEDELETLGYDRDYLSIKYNCEKCKDSGYIDNRMCSCLKEYLSKGKPSSPLYAREGSFEEFDEMLFSDSTSKFKTSPRANILKNRNTALAFVNNFEDSTKYYGLFMTGTVGSGKTFLATSIGKLIEKKGYTVECLTAKEFEDAIKDFSSSDYEKKKDDIMKSDLLIIDDLGIETKSTYVINEILKLLEYRITYKLKMIITSNLTIKELNDIYESRIYSRIVSNFTKLGFYGDDIRIAKRMKK